MVEGKPLLLLGNDFLEAHQATVRMGEGDDGSGTITLKCKSRGQLVDHVVHTTVDPAVAFSTVASVDDATGDSTGDSPGTEPLGTQTASTGGAPVVVEPLPGVNKPTASADKMVSETLTTTEQTEHQLYSEQAIVVPPRSKVTVWLRAPLEYQGKAGHYLIEHLPMLIGVETDVPPVECRVVTPDADHRVPVTIWNSARKVRHIPGFTPVAQLCVEIEVLSKDCKKGGGVVATYATLPEAHKKLVDATRIDPNGQLTEAQRMEVKDELAANIEAFALDPKAPGKTHVMRVDLPLKPGASPHRHAASRVGEAGREIVEKHVAEMESRGIIRKSNSPWASRIVLVKKKGGEIRFCIDFRDCNSKLQYLDSPIPLTVEALDKLSSGKGDRSTLFLSTLDLASGFWCLPIREEDKGITAFTTGRAKYEFNYLPFGIQSGPSYMSRLMDAVLQGLAWEVCMPYIDDVGIWSTGQGETHEERCLDSFQQMKKRLSLVLGRLRGAGLTCKASKCVLFATEAEYLGHIVSREGLKMDPKKIEKVEAIAPESINTLERVRAFLGLCSYYRRFIPQFSKIAAPLTDLTQKGVDVEAESKKPECQAAIVALKKAITSEPVLTAPRFDRMFKVKTDGAQTEGLGGVLGQDDDEGHERVIAYYGRRLNKHERNYTVTEIELLAAIESIRNWRPYLWGRHFKLIIDHSALKWLHSLRDTIEGGPASRLMRWILKLSEYDFEVEHKAGKIHTDADGLSRLVAMLESYRRFEWDVQSCRLAQQPQVVASVNCAQIVAEVDGPTGQGEPADGTAGTKKIKRKRRPVVTARRLQRAARFERNRNTSRQSIIQSYLTAGGAAKEMKDQQNSDAETSAFRHYLDTGELPPVVDKDSMAKAHWMVRESRHLVLEEGVLVHLRPDNGKTSVYVPEPARETLMTAFHDFLGHQGAFRMLALLRSRYYWPGMQRDVCRYTSECHECTLAKLPPRRDRRSRAPEIGSYPFDLLYCDEVDMEKTADYDAEKGTGYSKALVFADSLSHWVEVVPFHASPTSEQVLDAFMFHVVSRYGVPRGIASDQGSNLSSTLCRIVQEQTGVDLTFAPSDHHESSGLVERFIQTLVNMTRATDEGGEHWVDHLPFLLMSYRATPTRVCRWSPAELLYGRQLRLPAQLGEKTAPAGADLPKEIQQYAEKLHARLKWAWEAARDTVHRSQTEHESTTSQTSLARAYELEDRVCRLLPPSAVGNKLQYIYAGPYRVAEVLSTGRYRLRDLENKMLTDVFDTSQLRAYRARVDAEELQADEYLVDEIMGHRDRPNTEREFQVKWRGYARAQSTWEPRSELMRRCDDLVHAYENTLEAVAQRVPKPKRRAVRAGDELLVHPRQPTRPQSEYESDDMPSSARFARGRWEYGRLIATPRGRTLRWFQPSAFTQDELDSTHLQKLRTDASAGQADVAVMELELQYNRRAARAA